ncbi:hypothetical protein M3B11_07320 [Brevibacterium sp. p3-SID960]|uniref:hypothetical protein n=1 Tax=Brevibacterium sp. p3-SID960 TaxID=2916063 RepID=UPI0021A629F3|nr:hypothetical protein [Brevibacterium sp. p3-SID960]MCT1690765.1 hypothetical protein [Brevibacterium sp. p3-SID960]
MDDPPVGALGTRPPWYGGVAALKPGCGGVLTPLEGTCAPTIGGGGRRPPRIG